MNVAVALPKPDAAWAMMLGATPAPGDDTPPPHPRALSLNREVKAHIAMTPGTPRSHGFHPSEMPYLCPALFYFVVEAREDLLSDDPKKVQAAFDFIRKVVDAKEAHFSPALKMEFRVGDAIHTEVQYRLGVLGKLWGRWECSECKARVGPNWMPRIWARDVKGGVIPAPAPCVQCNGANCRGRSPWTYVEPFVANRALGIVGHVDGDMRVQINGWWYRYILEIKSINKAGFEGTYGVLPKPEHIIQASIYGWLMGVEFIQFVYVCKDQVNRWKEFVVPVDPAAIEMVKQKILAVSQACEQGVPPREQRICPNVQDEQAKKCPAVERCFGCKPVLSFWDE